MTYVYRPRGMPTRFMRTAPPIVREKVIDVIEIDPPAPLNYDVILRPDPGADEIIGVDFDKSGSIGCHFFLTSHQARAYRERKRTKRVAWYKLPEATQKAILRYLTDD